MPASTGEAPGNATQGPGWAPLVRCSRERALTGRCWRGSGGRSLVVVVVVAPCRCGRAPRCPVCESMRWEGEDAALALPGRPGTLHNGRIFVVYPRSHPIIRRKWRKGRTEALRLPFPGRQNDDYQMFQRYQVSTLASARPGPCAAHGSPRRGPAPTCATTFGNAAPGSGAPSPWSRRAGSALYGNDVTERERTDGCRVVLAPRAEGPGSDAQRRPGP